MLDAMHASRDCAPAALGELLDFEMHVRRDGRAVDEELAGGVDQQVVVVAEDLAHRRVIGDDRENHVRACGHIAKRRARGRADFARERGDCRAIRIEQRRDVIAAILQPTRHVRAHASDSDKPDIHIMLFRLHLSFRPKWRNRLLPLLIDAQDAGK